jgi:hypothetical protein
MASSPFGGAVSMASLLQFQFSDQGNMRQMLPGLRRRAHNSGMDKRRLEQIEQYVLGFFQAQQRTHILAKELFASTNDYANADMVRALEDLEKRERLLVRHTKEGNDYVTLTAQGAAHLGLEKVDLDDDLSALPHPPKSATKGV